MYMCPLAPRHLSISDLPFETRLLSGIGIIVVVQPAIAQMEITKPMYGSNFPRYVVAV